MIYSLEAEQAILSSIMLQSSDFVDVTLREDHFYHPEHQAIWSAMRQLSEKGQSCDMITVTDKVPDFAGYIIELCETGYGVGKAKDYVPIVIEKWKRRVIAESCGELLGEAAHQDLDVLVASLDSITERFSSGEYDLAIPPKKALNEALAAIDDRFRNGGDKLRGVSTGLTALDEKTQGLQKSDLIILAARPSMGKTALALNLAMAVARSGPVFLFSIEMPRVDLIERMMSAQGRINYGRIRSGALIGDDWERLTAATVQLMDLPIIIDDRSTLTPSDMNAAIRAYIEQYGHPALIVVDYLQLMSPGIKVDSQTHAIEHISRQLKMIAKRYECPILALSQLNRGLESRNDKRPVNSDLRQSGAIEQDADVIAFIYRDVVYNPDTSEPNLAEIIIGKQRNGPIGAVHTAFSGDVQRFDNLAYEFKGNE
jgi:replicative DNA helicase